MVLIGVGVAVLIVSFILLSLDSFGEFKFRPRSFLAVFALLICVAGGIKSVPTGHTGVVTTFGKVEDYTLEAGIHFINPISRVIKIDNRTQKETVEFSAFSSDIQEVEVV